MYRNPSQNPDDHRGAAAECGVKVVRPTTDIADRPMTVTVRSARIAEASLARCAVRLLASV